MNTAKPDAAAATTTSTSAPDVVSQLPSSPAVPQSIAPQHPPETIVAALLRGIWQLRPGMRWLLVAILSLVAGGAFILTSSSDTVKQIFAGVSKRPPAQTDTSSPAIEARTIPATTSSAKTALSEPPATLPTSTHDPHVPLQNEVSAPAHEAEKPCSQQPCSTQLRELSKISEESERMWVGMTGPGYEITTLYRLPPSWPGPPCLRVRVIRADNEVNNNEPGTVQSFEFGDNEDPSSFIDAGVWPIEFIENSFGTTMKGTLRKTISTKNGKFLVEVSGDNSNLPATLITMQSVR